MWDVKTALRRQIAAERVIVIADACHSAGTADGQTVGGGNTNYIAGSFESLFTPSRRLMMTAADTNEFSLEDARWGGHGVFTHFMLDGLGGRRGRQRRRDRHLHGALRAREQQRSLRHERPTESQKSGFGDIPLAIVESGAN